MRAVAVIRALGPIDLRSIRRDSFLVWMALLPFGFAALLRWGLPALTTWLNGEFEFDLEPYAPVVVGYVAVLLIPMVVGQVVGFLLLDERDNDTLTALLVTPLRVRDYLLYRIGVPLGISAVTSCLAFSAAGVAAWMPLTRLVPVALMAALEAPIVALLLASFVADKVQGFAFVKSLGSVQAVPALAIVFLDPPWHYAAGILPNYWPLMAFLAEGPGAFATLLTVGTLVHLGLLIVLVRRFQRVVRR